MPLDYAVGILDYRLIWNDALADAESKTPEEEAAAATAAASVPSDAVPPAQEVAAVAQEGEASSSPSCFPELDEDAIQQQDAIAAAAAAAAAAAENSRALHPEFRKLDVGISAIRNAALEPALAFLKSAVERLKKRMTDPRAGEELGEAKDAAVDVFSTSFDADDKLRAIKLALVSQILIFLNTSMEEFGLQEKLRAIQSTRRGCLLFLKKLNQLKFVRQIIAAKIAVAAEKDDRGQQQQQDQQQQDQQQQQQPDQDSIRLNEVFAMNLQTCAFLRLIHQKVLVAIDCGVGGGGGSGGGGAATGSGEHFAASGREKSEAAIVAEIVGGGGGGFDSPPEIRLEEGPESIFKVMGLVYRQTADEDLRTLVEFEVEELVDCFCATADEAYWRMAAEACDAIDVSIRRKALKKVHPRLEELMERLFETGEMRFLRQVLKMSQTTGFSPPMEKEALVQIQKIINKKLDLFDDIKDLNLLKDIAAFISATGFVQLLESCRRECGAVVKAAEAALCRCSTKSAADLDAANAFNEKSVYPWISAKVAERLAAAGAAAAAPASDSDAPASPQGAAVNEWLQRSFDSPRTICFVAIKAPSMPEFSPMAIQLLGCDADALAAEDTLGAVDEGEWTKVLEVPSTGGWKGGDWKAFAVDKIGQFKHWRIRFMANGGGEKVSLKSLKLFL